MGNISANYNTNYVLKRTEERNFSYSRKNFYSSRYQDIPILESARRCGIYFNQRTLDRAEVEAKCPFCGDKQNRYHLCINTTKDVYYCQLCGARGNSVSLFARLHNISYSDAAQDLLGDNNIYPFPQKPKPKASPEREPKPLPERHDVYYEMLNHLTLIDKHLSDLHERGLSDERIMRNMYKTLPKSNPARRFLAQMLADFYHLKGIPGFYTDKDGKWNIAGKPGLLIPYFNKDGYIQGLQVRLDDEDLSEDKRRYRWLSSRYNENGTKSGTYIHVTGDITSKIAYFTEGGLKGDVASFLDNEALFVCVAGVNAIDGLAEVIKSLNITEIVIAADMDKVTNWRVRNAFENAAREISKIRGVRARSLDWNVSIKGIDDHHLMRRKAYARGQNMEVCKNNITNYVQDLWKKEYPKQNAGWIGSCEWIETVRPLCELEFQYPKNLKKAKEYKIKMDNGVVFPPVICINGVVIDGLHRCWAYSKVGREYVHVYENKPFELQKVA